MVDFVSDVLFLQEFGYTFMTIFPAKTAPHSNQVSMDRVIDPKTSQIPQNPLQ